MLLDVLEICMNTSAMVFTGLSLLGAVACFPLRGMNSLHTIM